MPKSVRLPALSLWSHRSSLCLPRTHNLRLWFPRSSLPGFTIWASGLTKGVCLPPCLTTLSQWAHSRSLLHPLSHDSSLLPPCLTIWVCSLTGLINRACCLTIRAGPPPCLVKGTCSPPCLVKGACWPLMAQIFKHLAIIIFGRLITVFPGQCDYDVTRWPDYPCLFSKVIFETRGRYSSLWFEATIFEKSQTEYLATTICCGQSPGEFGQLEINKINSTIDVTRSSKLLKKKEVQCFRLIKSSMEVS